MNTSLLQLLSSLISANQNSAAQPKTEQTQNSSFALYPPEARLIEPQKQAQEVENENQNPLAALLGSLTGQNSQLAPLLSALLSKGGNPLASIMETQKKESHSSTKDEILL